MTNKHIIITGCSTGIGHCLTQGLHKQGYQVTATARKQSDCDRLQDIGLSTCLLDLNHSQSIHSAVDRILEATGGNIYGLINNGAYGQPGAVEDLSRGTLVRQFETNVFGTQELTNLVVPHMRRNNRGRIIQISSILGFVCLKYRGAYNASKYALEALTDTMRLELAGSGIYLSLIEPGPVESKFRENAYKCFLENINRANSIHADSYRAIEARLLSQEPVRFTLPPEAVLKAVSHALTSRNPKIRYRVTTPTKIMAPLKRLLPDRIMDKFLVGR